MKNGKKVEVQQNAKGELFYIDESGKLIIVSNEDRKNIVTEKVSIKVFKDKDGKE